MAPGALGAAMTIGGNLILNSGATYLVSVSSTNGNNSSAAVAGTAALDGTLQINVGAGVYANGNSYTLLTSAGGVTGTFAGTNYAGSFGSGTLATLTYNANSVVLSITNNTDIVWKASPGTNDWGTGTNWTSNSVPTAADVAKFSTSSVTSIDVKAANTQVSALQFDAGASAYTINVTGAAGTGASSLIVGGAGVINNSGVAQNFTVSGVAGNAGTLQFKNAATAADSTITTSAFGTTLFTDSATGGSAKLVTATGGTVDIAGLTTSGMTAGSIEGAGSYVLGAKSLTVGSLDTSTEVSGVISGTGGSLTKLGTGTLTLSGANTYTGGTTIAGGTLQIGNGGTTGSIQGDVTNNANLAFNRSDTHTYAGAISGSGAVQQLGSGTTILTGDSTSTGGTTIAAGTLQLGNGGTTGSVAGNVVDNGTLAVNRSNAVTIAGTISGTGSLQQLGAGTTTLTADNTYSGGTTISAGTLQLGDGGAAGSIAGNVTNNGTLAVNRSDVFTLAGTITGTGAFNQAGTGTTILTGTNTYTGSTTVSAGTLQIGSGGALGSMTGDVVNNATFVVNRSDTLTLSGAISGSGSVQQLGSGTTVLTGDASHSGGTIITAGTLQIGNGGATGSLLGKVTDDGTFAINRSDAVTFAGIISGAGSFQQSGAGTTTLTGTNTYTGGTTISAGVLQIGNGGTVGAIDGAIVNNAALIVNRSNAITLSGDISGSGTFEQMGTGTTTLTGTLGITGTTTVSAGTLQLGDGNTGGAVNGNVVNNATLAVNRSDTIALSGAVSGTGAFNQLGTGTTILTGTNTYIGSTTIAAGTLQLGDGGNTGSIAGNVVNNAILAFNRANDYTYAGTISGTGALQQNGAGTTTLSGTGSYTGATTITAGNLSVIGDISASSGVAVNGGTLSGIGRVSSTTVANGATLAPGTTIATGTLSVNGNLTLAANSIHQVKVSASAGSDLVNATGTTTVTTGAVLKAVDLGGFIKPNQVFTVLNATGGVTGSFNLLTQGYFGGAKVTLTQDANKVYVNLTSFDPENIPTGLPQDSFSVVLPATLATNQSNVVDTINTIVLGGGTVPTSFNGMSFQSAATVGNMITQITGEAGTGAPKGGIQLTNSFLPLVLNPFVSGRGGLGGFSGGGAVGFAEDRSTWPRDVAAAYAAVMPGARQPFDVTPEKRWNVWGSVYGGWSKTAGDQGVVGSHDTSSRAGGLATGFDYRLTPDTVVGFALAGGATSYSLADGLGGGTSEVFQVGAYGSRRFGDAYVSAAAAFALHRVTTDRYVTIAGTDHLNATFNAFNYGGRLEVGYRFATPHVGITPYSALQVQVFRTPTYTETALAGSSAFALTYSANSTTAVRTELGAWFDKSLPLENGATVMLNARTAWAHDEASGQSVNATFQSLPGSSFTVNGATPAANTFLATVGAEIQLPGGIAVGAKLDGEFAKGSRTYQGTGTVRYNW